MKRIFLHLLLIFLIVSCTLESTYSLPNDEDINPQLIGKWYDGKDTTEVLTVTKHSERSYQLSLKIEETTDQIISFSKTINGFEIMNLKTEYKGKVAHVFYGFKIKGDTLIFNEVNNKLRNTDFKSENEVLEFFKENIDNKDFFNNPTQLIRI